MNYINKNQKRVYHLNDLQKNIYRRVVYGIKTVPENHLKNLTFEQVRKMKQDYINAQEVLNTLKQDICTRKTNLVFEKLFPRSKFVQELVTIESNDPTYFNSMSFKDLGITKEMIIDKLIEAEVLPENFYELV